MIDSNGNIPVFLGIILVGAIGGGLGQLVGDVITSAMLGKIYVSSWQTYAGAVSGGVVSMFGYLGGGPVLAGTLSSATSFAVTTKLSGGDLFFGDLAINSALGGTTGFLTGNLVNPGLTSGKNSYDAIMKSISKKAVNGTITNVSTNTIFKGTTVQVVTGMLNSSISGIANYSKSSLKQQSSSSNQYLYDQIINYKKYFNTPKICKLN